MSLNNTPEYTLSTYNTNPNPTTTDLKDHSIETSTPAVPNSKPDPDLDPTTTENKSHINEDQPPADSNHKTKNNPNTNHNPITTEVNDHIIKTLIPAVANSKTNPDLDPTTTENKSHINGYPTPADSACKCSHSIANIDSDFNNQPSSIMKDAKCAF